MDREIEINGQKYSVVHVSSNNKWASGKLRGNQITISIPSRWPRGEASKIAEKLEANAIWKIQNGKWKSREMNPVEFSHGQEFEVLGRKFRVTNPSNHAKIRKGISKKILPDLEKRIHQFNSVHFNANIKRVSLRDNSSRWGSYSPRGSISLNFRLLFAPDEILDYVIVHELAHSKYRGHGPRFWDTVARVIPNHKEKRRWLRENGCRLGPETNLNSLSDK